jgi:hypothetical protein
MAGLPQHAGEYCWRHASTVKYTMLAAPQWRLFRQLWNAGEHGWRRAGAEKYDIFAAPQ